MRMTGGEHPDGVTMRRGEEMMVIETTEVEMMVEVVAIRGMVTDVTIALNLRGEGVEVVVDVMLEMPAVIAEGVMHDGGVGRDPGQETNATAMTDEDLHRNVMKGDVAAHQKVGMTAAYPRARWTAAPPEAGRTRALPGAERTAAPGRRRAHPEIENLQGIERMEVPLRTKRVKNDGHLQNQKRANQEMKRTKMKTSRWQRKQGCQRRTQKSRKMMQSKNSKREKKRKTKTRRKRERKRKRGRRTHKKTWNLK